MEQPWTFLESIKSAMTLRLCDPSPYQRALRSLLGSLLTITLFFNLATVLTCRFTRAIPGYSASIPVSATPIPCHSHNDYWRDQPLLSAIQVGCIGVEADVWPFQGELYIGHDQGALQPNSTFSSIYVEPLVRILEQKNQAFPGGESWLGVFDSDPSQTLVLLIDLKLDGGAAWPILLQNLEPLRRQGWLSTTRDGSMRCGPVTVVGTGDTPFELVLHTRGDRDVFFDAPLAGLEKNIYGPDNSYYASASLSQAVGKVAASGLSQEQLDVVRHQIIVAHERGIKARYWGLPSWPLELRDSVWDSLLREGLDILNVDNLSAAAEKLSPGLTTEQYGSPSASVASRWKSIARAEPHTTSQILV